MRAVVRLAVMFLALGSGACTRRVVKLPLVTGGDAARGRRAIAQYGCGACHTIPGVIGARGLVGPPLADLGRRVYIAGVLMNRPENLVRWIRDSPGVDSATAMPNLGVTEQDARDIAEYLYRLSGGP